MSDETRERGLRSKDIIPVLAFVSYVLVNLWGKSRWSWILLVIAGVSVILDHYAGLKRTFLRWERWKESRADDKAAGKAFVELQEFVRRFEQFVRRQTNDTLHYIVESDIHRGQPALRADCQLPNVDIWIYQRQYFSQRVDRQTKTMKELRPALTEFHYLVASYNNFCVAPILEVLPANIRAKLPQRHALTLVSSNKSSAAT